MGLNPQEQTFAKAFAEARRQGLTEFTWRGKRYHTRRADETPAQWMRQVARAQPVVTKAERSPFAQAFAEARRQGLAEFTWRGRRYTTRRADESMAQWARQLARATQQPRTISERTPTTQQQAPVAERALTTQQREPGAGRTPTERVMAEWRRRISQKQRSPRAVTQRTPTTRTSPAMQALRQAIRYHGINK